MGVPMIGQTILRLLRQLHGSKCERCGWSEQLEFHSVSQAGWKAHGSGVNARARYYTREHAAGRLRLLCRECHAIAHLKHIASTADLREQASRKDPGSRPVCPRCHGIHPRFRCPVMDTVTRPTRREIGEVL
jgi:hypothetical protein